MTATATAIAIAIAERLASALDAEDYATAATCLAADCIYVTRKETLHGPEAILASYREAGEWVQAHVQSHTYDHRVRPGPGADPACATVTYIDHLSAGGVAHTYSCEQVLWVGPEGVVVKIEHQEIPGEPESLALWMRKVGLDRS